MESLTNCKDPRLLHKTDLSSEEKSNPCDFLDDTFKYFNHAQTSKPKYSTNWGTLTNIIGMMKIKKIIMIIIKILMRKMSIKDL